MSNSDGLKTDIKNFINVFNEHLEFMKLKLVRYDSLYKKIICVGIIDTLSKSVYPSENQNRKRFTKFLINYAQTGLWNKVSLGHLIRLLKYTNNPTVTINTTIIKPIAFTIHIPQKPQE